MKNAKTLSARVIALLIAAVVLTTSLTGCGDNQPKLSEKQQIARERNLYMEKRISKGFSTFEADQLEDLQIYLHGSDKYKENFEPVHINFEITRVEKDLEEEINLLCADVCDFLSKFLERNWKNKPVEVYRASKHSNAIGQCIDGVIVLYNEYNPNSLEQKVTIVHELIHYLMELNNGTMFCLLHKGDKVAGCQLHEGIVEYLSYQYMQDVCGKSPLDTTDGKAITHAYTFLVYSIEGINAVWGIDFPKEVLLGNIDKVQAEVDNSTKAGTFVIILNYIDRIYDDLNNADMHSMYSNVACLTQLFFFVADSKADKKLISLTKEYLYRAFYITPNITKANTAIGSWNYVASLIPPKY